MTTRQKVTKRNRVTVSADMPIDDFCEKIKPLVMYIVSRFKGTPVGWSHEDMIQEGMFAAIKSFRSFDASRGVPLRSWCARMINRALIDAMRSSSLISRSTYHKYMNISKTKRELCGKGVHNPTIKQLSENMGDKEFTQSSISEIIYLVEDLISNHSSSGVVAVNNSDDQLSDIIKRNEKSIINSIVEGLPVQERTAIRLRYWSGLSLREIARTMSCSESWVYHLCNTARDYIRDRLIFKYGFADRLSVGR